MTNEIIYDIIKVQSRMKTNWLKKRKRGIYNEKGYFYNTFHRGSYKSIEQQKERAVCNGWIFLNTENGNRSHYLQKDKDAGKKADIVVAENKEARLLISNCFKTQLKEQRGIKGKYYKLKSFVRRFLFIHILQRPPNNTDGCIHRCCGIHFSQTLF